MRRFLFTVLAVLLCQNVFSSSASAYGAFTRYVNPFVGTDFHGHTFPGAAWPFGMVQLSPDTRPMAGNWDGCSGYHYSDDKIYGFSHTHLSGTGCDDLCDILFMPVNGWTADGSEAPALDRERYASHFSHEREAASPGYYEVFLDDPQVLARLTVGRRCGMHEYSFSSGKPQLVIDLKHRDALLDGFIRLEGERSVSGYRLSSSWSPSQDIYFWAEFSQDIGSFTDCAGTGAQLSFKGGRTLKVRIGISSVSVENARLNLRSELGTGDWDFEALRASADAAWDAFLSKIDVRGEDVTLERLRTFYTALYHTAIHPSLYSDVNGEYRGMDRQVHKADGFERYHIFSLWDTFRSLHPLFAIIERARTVDFLKSFQSVFDECGKLPMWELAGYETNCMIGYNSVSVIADALAKGIDSFDVEAMFDAMLTTAELPEFGRDSFREDGAVIADREHESVSKTLEYAYDAWCVAKVADYLAERYPDSARYPAIAADYYRYAAYWRNIFDPSTGFMRARLNGQWLSPFNPREVNNHFTEANSWQYSFFVPQNVEGHISALGGPDAYVARLDSLFTAPQQIAGRQQADITGLIGQYAHGNEPSHHIPYLYAYAGQPWKTNERVREILATLYSSAPDGLCGNEDCGQMSAWYVMSSIGLYSVTPGSTQMVLTSPLFPEVKISLENKCSFRISSVGDGVYVKDVRLNGGDPSLCSFIDFQKIMNGGELLVELSPEPSPSFGAAYFDRPRSSLGTALVPNPVFVMDSAIFAESVEVAIDPCTAAASSGSGAGVSIYYRILPGSAARATADVSTVLEPGFSLYKGPLVITENCSIEAYSEAPDGARSHLVRTSLHKIHSDMKISILSHYSPQYSAGGDEGLIDGIRGTTNWRTGSWQGHQGTDFTAVVDLLSAKYLKGVSAGFLQDAKSWIWMPSWVDYYLSSDGENWAYAGRAGHTVGDRDYTIQTVDLGILLDDEARYIKVVAKNYGTIPDWHPGAGGEAYIFIDEITVDY